jgi:hypothetical protein
MNKTFSVVILSIAMALDAGALLYIHIEDQSPSPMRVLKVTAAPCIIELKLDVCDSMGPWQNAIVVRSVAA